MLWDVVEATELSKRFPILRDVRASVRCPLRASGNCAMHDMLLDVMSMVGHLNDIHRWPRCESDRNEHNQHLPTISGWLQEEAEKNGWDLTCRPLSK